MRSTFLPVLVAAMLAAAPAFAVDHNNIDANRPLSFDDAEAIAYRERAIEAGASLNFPWGRSTGLELEAEFLYGFALNTHLNIGFDPSIGGRTESADEDFDIGDVSIGLFRNLNREMENTPAFGVRGDVFLPTGRDSRGVDVRLRGIMSKVLNQYDRWHLNADLNFAMDPEPGERSFYPGLILGYSRPLGYPRRFDRTGVAELAVQGSPEKGVGAVVSVGVGLRQLVRVRSVFDVGGCGRMSRASGARPAIISKSSPGIPTAIRAIRERLHIHW